MRDVSGFDELIVTLHKPLYVFLILLIMGFLSELKMVTSFFVKIAEQPESQSFPIERRLALFKVWIRMGLCGR